MVLETESTYDVMISVIEVTTSRSILCGRSSKIASFVQTNVEINSSSSLGSCSMACAVSITPIDPKYWPSGHTLPSYRERMRSIFFQFTGSLLLLRLLKVPKYS